MDTILIGGLGIASPLGERNIVLFNDLTSSTGLSFISNWGRRLFIRNLHAASLIPLLTQGGLYANPRCISYRNIVRIFSRNIYKITLWILTCVSHVIKRWALPLAGRTGPATTAVCSWPESGVPELPLRSMGSSEINKSSNVNHEPSHVPTASNGSRPVLRILF